MLTAVHVHVHVIEHVNIEVYMYTVQYDVVTSSANFVQVHIQASVLLCKITFRLACCSNFGFVLVVTIDYNKLTIAKYLQGHSAFIHFCA